MYWIVIIGILIIPAIAQMMVSYNYSKFKKIENENNVTGFDVARKMLDANGLEKIYIVETKGNLTDHYDPSKKVVRLSTDVYHGSSVASAAIAAHECGHAIQDKEGYFYMKFRAMIFPVVRIATSLSYAVILLGFIFEAFNLISIGIALVGMGLLFQVVTLPVELNASKRAKEALKKLQLTNSSEDNGVSKVLGAAAMTYVAGVLASAADLLRLILIFGNRND